MTFATVFAVGLAVLTLAYLVYTLLRPERF
jgi:K+-transporting ATPase KdpF subunit